MFYISVVNVHFPENVGLFLPFLQASNADNPYLRFISYFFIPEKYFTRGIVNDKIGPKAFYVSSADKLPILVPILIIF